MSFSGYDFESLDTCTGIIDYIDGEETRQIEVFFPCGARFDVHVAGSSNTQLPYRYQVLRERAALAPCCYWQEPITSGTDIFDDPDSTLEYNFQESDIPAIFSYAVYDVTGSGNFFQETGIDPETEEVITVQDPDPVYVGGWEHEGSPSFLITPRSLATFPLETPIPTRCVKPEAVTWHQGLDGRPPCNGAKTSCPHYTGYRFEYIRDEQLDPGITIRGEAVQELRSLIKDWINFPDPQEEWEDSFELPYIWARDFGDLPLILNQDDLEIIEEAEPITLLTQVYWDAETGEVQLPEFPSEPESTELDGLTPPDFPTTVNNLTGVVGANIKVTFPYLRSEDNFIFNYSTFGNVGHKMYVAGISRPGSTVFVINRSILNSFPDLTSGAVSDEDITDFVNTAILQSFTLGNYSGYSSSYTNQDSFWEFRDGIDLDPNVDSTTDNFNEIYVLSLINDVWNYVRFVVSYKFYHCDIVQTGFTGRWPIPDTKDIRTRVSSLPSLEDVNFRVIPFTRNVPRVGFAYHFLAFDRSYQRFLNGESYLERPDERYWGIRVNEQSIVEGTSLTTSTSINSLRWSKFDRCNRYLIELLYDALPEVGPAGADRSWDYDTITFEVQDPNNLEAQEIEMVLVEEGSWSGRSFNGILFPSRFLIVEPKENVDVVQPPPTARMRIEPFYIFFPDDGPGIGGDEDVFPQVIDSFPDPNLNLIAAGESMPPLDPFMEAIPSPHELEPNDDDLGFSAGNVSKQNMSYIVEIVDETNRVIGSKWVLGVGDKADFWIRDIDIRYAWGAGQSFRKLLPDYAAAVTNLITGETYEDDIIDAFWTNPLERQRYTTYYPQCGDHDLLTGKGALYHPYDSCFLALVDIYDLGIRILFNPKTQGYVDLDEKYRGPLQQTVKTYKHNVVGSLSDCVWEFSIGTFTRGGSDWAGYGRLRGPISPFFNDFIYGLHLNFGWRFPQFGNRGRIAMRVYRTGHYVQYVYVAQNGSPRIAEGWLPIVPYLSAETVFSYTDARTIFDYSIGAGATAGLNLDIDYDTYEGHLELLGLSEPDSADLPLPEDPTTEKFIFKRYSFNKLFNVDRVRTFEGIGVRWPKIGYYFNFAFPQIVWVYPEEEVDIVRQSISLGRTNPIEADSVTLGVYIRKPSSPFAPNSVKDRYDRPVHISLEEKEYTLHLKDVSYTIGAGGQVEVEEPAHLYLENGEYKLYFDRFTGEILTTDPNTSSPALHTIDNIPSLVSYLEQNEIDMSLNPIFNFVFSFEQDLIPEAVSGVDTFINTGNLYASLDTMNIFLEPSLEGALFPEPESFTWAGFIPSIQVDKIAPQYLPAAEECIISSLHFQDIIPTVNFSSWPSTEPTVREAYSNIELDPIARQVLGCGDFFGATNFEWRFLDQEDIDTGPPETPLEVDQRKGQIEAFTIVFTFPVIVDLARIKFNYRVAGAVVGEGLNEIVLPPEVDPSISLILENTQEANVLEIFSKPRRELNLEFGTTFFEGRVEADLTSSFVSYFNKIRLEIGFRSERTSFQLGRITINGKVLRDVEEKFPVLEPRYSPSIGLYDPAHFESGLYYPSQSPDYLAGIATPRDVSDPLETVGICEFWQPGIASLNDHESMISIGRIRRHYAGSFSTWDTSKFLGESQEPYVFNRNLEELERMQEEEHSLALDNIDSFPQVPVSILEYFLPPYSRFQVSKLKDRSFVRGLSDYIIVTSVDRVSPDLEGRLDQLLPPISVPQQEPGWQLRGYYACLPNCCREISCTGLSIIGLRQRHAVYNKRLQQVCSGLTGAANDQFDLFELPRDVNRPGLIGAGANAGAVTLTPYDALAQFLSDNFRNSITGRDYRFERFQEYLEENDLFQR